VDREETFRLLRERIVKYGQSHVSGFAEDLVQDAITLLLDKYKEKDQLDDLIPLGIAVMKNKISDLRRSSGFRAAKGGVDAQTASLPSKEPRPDQVFEKNERTALLVAGVRRLSEDCRELLKFRVQGMSTEQIHKHRPGWTLENVNLRIYRCKEKLRGFMQTSRESTHAG
jgi:RNA polymerase sigma factor (sigma-70 family)